MHSPPCNKPVSYSGNPTMFGQEGGLERGGRKTHIQAGCQIPPW